MFKIDGQNKLISIILIVVVNLKQVSIQHFYLPLRHGASDLDPRAQQTRSLGQPTQCH